MQDWTTYDADDVAAGLQDFLICVEMFIAALAHAYAFPPRDYMDPTYPKSGFVRSIRVMFDVRDVVDDVQYAVDDTVRFARLLGDSMSVMHSLRVVPTLASKMIYWAHFISSEHLAFVSSHKVQGSCKHCIAVI